MPKLRPIVKKKLKSAVATRSSRVGMAMLAAHNLQASAAGRPLPTPVGG